MQTLRCQKDHTGILFSQTKLEAVIEAAKRGECLEVFNNGKLFRTITPDSIISAIENPEIPFGGIVYHDYQGRGFPSTNELRLTR